MFLTKAKVTKKKARASSRFAPVIADAKLRLEAVVLRFFWMCSRLLGPKRASNVAAGLINWYAGPNSDIFRRLRRNIRVAIPGRSEAEIQRIARESAANLGRSIAEYPHLERIAGPALSEFIEYAADIPEAALTPERPPAIYIGVHQANWEILSSLGAPLGQPMTIVVSPLSNPFVHQIVKRARPDAWVEQSERDNATRSLIRCLQEGRSVGLLADQRFDGGEFIPFFGHDAKTAMGPAKIAIKFGCDLVPTRIERIGPVKFKITTFKAIRPDEELANDHDKAIDMMRRVNSHFEAWIQEKPGEWMCMKRRWPNQVYRTLDQMAGPKASEMASSAVAQ